jgi:hypothetical protein
MATRVTRKDAFGSYGIILRNVNWSVSGRSKDDRTVAVSIWEKDLTGQIGERVYDRPSWGDWYSGPGRRYFFEDLAWARDNCVGNVRIVLSIRKPGDSEPVQVAESYADHNLVMRVTHVDPETGAFRLEEVVSGVDGTNS